MDSVSELNLKEALDGLNDIGLDPNFKHKLFVDDYGESGDSMTGDANTGEAEGL